MKANGTTLVFGILLLVGLLNLLAFRSNVHVAIQKAEIATIEAQTADAERTDYAALYELNKNLPQNADENPQTMGSFIDSQPGYPQPVPVSSLVEEENEQPASANESDNDSDNKKKRNNNRWRSFFDRWQDDDEDDD